MIDYIGKIALTQAKLSDLVGQQVSKVYPLQQVRKNTSPYSEFYSLDVDTQDGIRLPLFIKRVSDKRRELANILPTGGKLVDIEEAIYIRGNGNASYPRFYGKEEDIVEVNGSHIRVVNLIMERGKKSLEDIFLELGEEEKIIYSAKHGIITSLESSKVILGQEYSEEEKLQVYRLDKPDFERDIRQAWAYLLFNKFGKGSQTLTPTQVRSMLNWMETRDYPRIIETCFRCISETLSPTQEDKDEKGRDTRALFDLDLHPGQLIQRESGSFFKVDNSKFGFGPLSLKPALILCQPPSIGKFSTEGFNELADFTFQENEVILDQKDKDSLFARKRRYDEQLPAAIRYAIFRILGYVTGLKVNYPKISEAVAVQSPIWGLKSCLPALIEYFVGLEDRFTPYFNKNVNDPLKSLLEPNGF